MPILIDTHALVWAVTDDSRLSEAARIALASPDERAYISVVTAFEFVDLNRRGRFGADLPFAAVVAQLDAVILDYPASAWAVALELPAIHLDPVDRMVVAHALHADLPLLTADRDIRRYPVRTLW